MPTQSSVPWNVSGLVDSCCRYFPEALKGHEQGALHFQGKGASVEIGVIRKGPVIGLGWLMGRIGRFLSEVEIGVFSKWKEQSEQKYKVKHEALLETIISVLHY